VDLARRAVLLAVALGAIVAFSGGLPGAGLAGRPAGVPPWDKAGPFPSNFDLRAATSGYVELSPVRQQDHYSTCWMMAATGALESATIVAEGATPLYSPNNLANHMASRLDYQGMAPFELAVAYYARWEGPVPEASDPYPGKDRSPQFLRAVRHVPDVLFLPPRAGPGDDAAVKWAVMTLGAVDVAASFHTEAELKNWNAPKSTYYDDADGEPNHHLLIVGWDDAFPASAFLRRPPGDGAFLVKNSWGQDFGDRGYLWVSYYDAGFGRAMAAFGGVRSAADHDSLYQHDALGRSDWIGAGGGESAWFADTFTCAGSGEVTAVSFYTPVAGTAYEVRAAGSLAEVPAAPAAAAGVAAVAGYHTVDLRVPAPVVAGHHFVVAVKVTTPGWETPVPVERPSALIAPRASPGQSFVSADGVGWTDLTSLAGLARANVCLKAFVDDPTGAGDTARPRVVVRAGSRRRRATVRWRLTDPAFSSASAIVVLEVRGGSGKVLARRRIPAVAVGERGTWTFAARWRPGEYVVAGRSFDVAGHRQARESRDVLVLRGARAAPAPERDAGVRTHRRRD
jgi:C1A family cysteine protease